MLAARLDVGVDGIDAGTLAISAGGGVPATYARCSSLAIASSWSMGASVERHAAIASAMYGARDRWASMKVMPRSADGRMLPCLNTSWMRSES